MAWNTPSGLLIAALVVAGIGVAPGFSQPSPVRVRGIIEKIEPNGLVITTKSGDHLTVRYPSDVRIVAIVRGALADITPGAFIGTTALPQQDGSLRAVEVHVFPEAMRGTGEGHRPWDLGPSTTMTNGTVAQAVSKVDGNVLTIKYRDGEKTVVVTPETTIVKYTPGEPGDLKPGAKVFISAALKQPDGSLQTERVNVGRDGLTPPM